MARTGFLSRMRGWVRTRGHRPDVADGVGDENSTAIADDGSVVRSSEDGDRAPGDEAPAAADAGSSAPPERATPTLSRRSRREYSLGKLQEGYDRVLEMMDEMHKHMRVQEDRTQEIAGAITQLSRSLADVPKVDQQQVQLLSTIAAQLETTTVRTQQLGDAIGELPRVVRQQTDTLSGIERQLEMGSESDAHMAGTLQSLSRSVDRLGESSDKHANALNEMQVAGDEHQRRLDEILHRQTRQFTALVVITAVLAVAAVVIGTVATVLQVR